MNAMQTLGMDSAGETGEVIFRAPCSLGSGGGEVEEAIAAGDGTLHGAIDFWQEKASYWKTRTAEALELADSEGSRAVAYLRRARKAEAKNAQSLECLIELKDRMELCIREGLSAYEAFDSFYAEMVAAAIAAATEGDKSHE